MRKKREFIEGAFYHVTSRTNDKTRIFANRLGQKIMLMVLQDAKDKYRYILANFCIMPTHFHLLIKPKCGTNLSSIMNWIKTNSAKMWNGIHGSTDHVWGHRYYERAVKDQQEFENIMNYIDQNPVKAGLSSTPEEWKACGAYYKVHNIEGIVDFTLSERRKYIKLLSPIPPAVSRLLPPSQLSYTLQYYGVYKEAIDNLYKKVQIIPKLDDTENILEPPVYLHYKTVTIDYFICEYDGADTMFGKVRDSIFPEDMKYQRFNLSELKKNEYLKLVW